MHADVVQEAKGNDLVIEEAEVMTLEQRQRMYALNAASAVTEQSTPSNALSKQGYRMGVLPGDLVRIAQWIMDGNLIQQMDMANTSVDRDKKTGWLYAYEIKTVQLAEGADEQELLPWSRPDLQQQEETQPADADTQVAMSPVFREDNRG